MAIVCKRVTYTGRVQGVGFRYTARQIAGGFPVAGFVRNVTGGNVELVAEGEADEVTEFLGAIARRMRGYITGADVREEPLAGHTRFEIRP
jgi:acylphosphatase